MRIAFPVLWTVLLLSFSALSHPSTAFGQFGESAVKTRVVAEHAQAEPGGRLVIAVELNHDDGFHTWPSAQTELPEEVAGIAIRTEVGLLGPAWAALDGVQYPPTHPDLVANPTGGPPIRAPLFSGRAVAFARLHIAPDAPLGEQSIRIAVNFQACDATNCQFPEEQEHEIKITIVAAGSPTGAPTDPALFASLDSDAWGNAPEFAATVPGPTPAPATTDQKPVPPPSTLLGFRLGSNIVVLALAAAIGGLVLNLTPCVLPVIPIKVMTLTQHATSRRHAIVLGLWMALGVVAFWAAIGLPMALVSRLLDPSQLIFGIWWVCMLIGLIVALLGLGIMGLFTFNLPQSVYMIETKADSPFGSFLFGVLAAVLGLPCFGFVAAGLLAPAATMPAPLIMAVFVGLGVGMAAPYLVLSAYPQLLKFIPRTGPASELVKQVMGILLLAAAAFFIAASIDVLLSEFPYLAGSMTWWSAGFFIALAGLWMTIRTFQITKRPLPRLVFPVLAVAMTLGIGVFANGRLTSDRESYLARQAAMSSAGTLAEVPAGVWLLYTPELLATVRESGRPVFLDFTAIWCVNCKALKAAVLDPMKEEFKARGVVLLEVDCSFRSSPGTKLLADLGRTGVPQWALYAPGAEKPQFIEFTTQSVLNALDHAGVPRGGQATGGTASIRP
ncbi:MAG: thioredoxin family protein [Phycisphaeraceae bacterium]|nr:thioredoxin family protein [Phycisphaeraceae bacterium]